MRQKYLDDLALVLSRRPQAWYRENVNGTVSVMSRAGDFVVLGTGPNRHEAITVAAREIRDFEAELEKIEHKQHG